MVLKLTVLIVLSLLTIANAGKITFSKVYYSLFVETDPFHYAVFGPVTDKDGTRIVVINGDDHYHQTSKCAAERSSLLGIDLKQTDSYGLVRERFLEEEKESPAISGKSNKDYIWSGTFFSDELPSYSATRLDDETVVYSSQYFPKNLARVIISGQINMFIHYDGSITMKSAKCLYKNEQILIDGIKKIDFEGKRNSLIYPKGEKALQKHLKSHHIDESLFDSEQAYIKTYAVEELAGVERAIKAAPFTSFSGWGP